MCEEIAFKQALNETLRHENKMSGINHEKLACKLVDEIVECSDQDPGKMNIDDVIEDWTYAVNE
jgi:hypothetical protein